MCFLACIFDAHIHRTFLSAGSQTAGRLAPSELVIKMNTRIIVVVTVALVLLSYLHYPRMKAIEAVL